jgi:hypothetical protein
LVKALLKKDIPPMLILGIFAGVAAFHVLLLKETFG